MLLGHVLGEHFADVGLVEDVEPPEDRHLVPLVVLKVLIEALVGGFPPQPRAIQHAPHRVEPGHAFLVRVVVLLARDRRDRGVERFARPVEVPSRLTEVGVDAQLRVEVDVVDHPQDTRQLVVLDVGADEGEVGVGEVASPRDAAAVLALAVRPHDERGQHQLGRRYGLQHVHGSASHEGRVGRIGVHDSRILGAEHAGGPLLVAGEGALPGDRVRVDRSRVVQVLHELQVGPEAVGRVPHLELAVLVVVVVVAELADRAVGAEHRVDQQGRDPEGVLLAVAVRIVLGEGDHDVLELIQRERLRRVVEPVGRVDQLAVGLDADRLQPVQAIPVGVGRKVPLPQRPEADVGARIVRGHVEAPAVVLIKCDRDLRRVLLDHAPRNRADHALLIRAVLIQPHDSGVRQVVRRRQQIELLRVLVVHEGGLYQVDVEALLQHLVQEAPLRESPVVGSAQPRDLHDLRLGGLRL